MKKMTVRINRSIYRIPLQEIVYLENERRKIHLHLVDGEYVFYGTFREVLEQLDDHFLCCSRSYILNKDHVRAMRHSEQYEIIMDDGRRILLCKNCFLRAKREFDRYIQERVRKRQDDHKDKNR